MSNHYFLYLYVLGMDARTMLNGVTYSKSLRLSNKARQVYLHLYVCIYLVLIIRRCGWYLLRVHDRPGSVRSWNTEPQRPSAMTYTHTLVRRTPA